MTLFDLQNLPCFVVIVVPYDTPKCIRIREVHFSKRLNRVVGFNAGGNDFDADGFCKGQPWVSCRPEVPRV